MGRITIQVDDELLDRVRQRATAQGVSVARVVREALEHELDAEASPPPVTSIGAIDSDAIAGGRETGGHGAYMPDAWR